MYNIRSNSKSKSMPMIAFTLILSLSVTVESSWAKTNTNQGAQSQSSLCIDPSLVQNAAKTDGITDPANLDKFAKSATSNNNFITICAGHKLTNGQQLPGGSCNPTPMGFLPSSKNMPSVRISSPSPTTKIAARQEFDVVIATRNIELGHFTSPLTTYYLAPQQLNGRGQIKGHLHVVIQLVRGQKPLDPLKFVFFKGVSDSATGGKVQVTITGGLPDDRIATLTSAMNHQLVALPVPKRGAVDDAVYIKVGTGVSSPEKSGGETAARLDSVNSNKNSGSKHIKGGGSGKGSDDENPEQELKKDKTHKKPNETGDHEH